MNINILSTTLANQISAGEVVERPASVVKELVENAIDAGSTQIDIVVEEAGLKKIQVIDNGKGIPAEEVERAFERHATSKIKNNEDLFRIRTLGFRGEALPSIASVSECLIETSTGDSPGKSLFFKGGLLVESSAGHSRKGTTITVEQLFYNTPARLKYVKSLKTELSHIADVINRSALAHPRISFRFEHDGNLYMKTPGTGDLKQAVAGVYGVHMAKKMREIQGENLDFTVSGLVSLPELTRASRNYTTLIVNGRFVRSYALSNAVVKGYGSKLMIGRFPIAVLDIKLDPLLVDVNVHPSKQEIRISKEDELMALIQQAVAESMSIETRIPHGLESSPNKKDLFQNQSEQTTLFTRKQREDARAKESFEQTQRKFEDSFSPLTSTQIFGDGQSEIQEPSAQIDERSGLEPLPSRHHEETIATAKKNLNQEDASKVGDFPDLEYIGQMHGTYLFAQNEEGFYMIDQHAAQERIKYEYYREEILDNGTALQELLVPIMLEYPLNDALIIQDKQDLLEEAGIHLEPFGRNSFIVRNHPSWFLKGQEESTIREMIDFLLDNNALSMATFREATAIMMSCKRSIKANHYLGDTEARQLLHDLKQTDNPYNCPHGRPVLIQFTVYEIERMFKRIQD